MNMQTNRRALLGAMALAPVAAMPAAAIAAPSRFETVIAEYWRTFHWFNSLPPAISFNDEERAGDVYHEAYQALVAEQPITGDQFARKFYALWSDGGRPNHETTEVVLEDARRLAGGLN